MPRDPSAYVSLPVTIGVSVDVAAGWAKVSFPL